LETHTHGHATQLHRSDSLVADVRVHLLVC